VRVTSTRVVYENPWMRVHEDRTEHPDGSPGLYSWVEKRPAALIVALEDGHTWLIEQLRHPLQQRYWEFPQGTGGVEGEALARAELAEETGLRAGSMEKLGHLYCAYGMSSQGFDVFLATGLTPGPTAREATEQDMRQRLVGRDEFEAMIRSGLVVDDSTLAAYALLLMREAGRL
jgi:8-oxo-dGTP pyrophosphatase MutT (NUDIX family)